MLSVIDISDSDCPPPSPSAAPPPQESTVSSIDAAQPDSVRPITPKPPPEETRASHANDLKRTSLREKVSTFLHHPKNKDYPKNLQREMDGCYYQEHIDTVLSSRVKVGSHAPDLSNDQYTGLMETVKPQLALLGKVTKEKESYEPLVCIKNHVLHDHRIQSFYIPPVRYPPSGC